MQALFNRKFTVRNNFQAYLKNWYQDVIFWKFDICAHSYSIMGCNGVIFFGI